MKVLVGLCGFSMGMRNYRRHFPVVEVQQTFYEPPKDATLKKWLVEAGASLEFTMKVWQLVTHPAQSPTYRRMKRALKPGEIAGWFQDSASVDEGWHRSVECSNVLRATGMLFQCPASFTPTRENVARMSRFFSRIRRPTAKLLWEPRGNAWVEQRDFAVSLCRDLDLTLVVDPFVSAPSPSLTSYWRLHGPGSAHQSYLEEQLQMLIAMLGASRSDTQQVAYVMFNNIPRVRDAERFGQLLKP